MQVREAREGFGGALTIPHRRDPGTEPAEQRIERGLSAGTPFFIASTRADSNSVDVGAEPILFGLTQASYLRLLTAIRPACRRHICRSATSRTRPAFRARCPCTNPRSCMARSSVQTGDRAVDRPDEFGVTLLPSAASLSRCWRSAAS